MRATEILDSLEKAGAEVTLRDDHLVVRPAWVAASYRSLIEEHRHRLMLLLAPRQVWPDAEGDPALTWARGVLRGGLVIAKRDVHIIEPGAGPAVVEPLGYLARQLASLRRARGMVVAGGLGKAWPPAWWQKRGEEAKERVRALWEVCRDE